jgi:hypothetical protein
MLKKVNMIDVHALTYYSYTTPLTTTAAGHAKNEIRTLYPTRNYCITGNLVYKISATNTNKQQSKKRREKA